MPRRASLSEPPHTSHERDDDIEAIRALIARQFESMSWTDGRTPDGAVFRADFLPDATLLASARPVRGQSVEAFVERMQELARASLRSFEETVLGSTIHVFGAVAVAVVACETLENGAEVNRNVEMMLLVKDAGRWRIAAQAWDKASANRPIPAELMGQR